MRRLAVVAALWLVGSEAARAQTDEIQIYDAQIAAPGIFNLTWHDNYTPDGRTRPDYPGGVVPNHTLNGVPEWAYGVAPWLEAAFYMPLYSLAGNGALTFNGFKLRALLVEPDAANQRFIYGVNFEFSYNTAHWNQNRSTQEIRPIFGWHLGRLDVIVNPISPRLRASPTTSIRPGLLRPKNTTTSVQCVSSTHPASSSISCSGSWITEASHGWSRAVSDWV